MDDNDHVEPQGQGRRALPAGGTGGPSITPRRGVPANISPPASGARRAVANGRDEQGSTPHRPWYLGAGGWVALAGAIIVGLALFNVVRPTAEAPPVVVSSSQPSSGAPAVSTSSAPASVDASTDEPNAPAPTDSAAPLPGTVSAVPASTPPPEPSPDGSAAAGLIELNDASFNGADGWTVYGDEMIEEDRRAVRLSDQDTDARFQAVTLLPGDADLAQSCSSLVDLQQTQFNDPTRELVVPVGTNAAAGSGVRCGFSGVRSSDGVASTVIFTLVSRASDSHVLMLRSTVPAAVSSDSPAVGQLNSMSCQASESFGVTLPLC